MRVPWAIATAVALAAMTATCGSAGHRVATVVRTVGADPTPVASGSTAEPRPTTTPGPAAPTTTVPAAAQARTTATTTATTVAMVAATATSVAVDPDVASLPDGGGARIAVVVDDAGGPEGSLQGYLDLPIALTVSVIPWNLHPAEHAERAFVAGKEVTLHLPLANRRGQGDGHSRLAGTESPDQVEAFVADAIARVPHAVGANNHEGPYGSAQPALMRSLLASLTRHGLFFMDSVTSQRTLGFAVEAELHLPPRVNNVFLDHFESDDDSRQALLHLAELAAANGAAIGICHVHHPYELHALQALQGQLRARGYVFAPLSQVTNGLTPGLDSGVRTLVPA